MKISIVYLVFASLLVSAEGRLAKPWYPCPVVNCLVDECEVNDCPQEYCITEPTYYYNHWWGQKCLGCPKFVRCEKPDDVPCCDLEEKPKDSECGLSGCTCCSGKWIPGNSGPSIPGEEVCKREGLELSKPCPKEDCCPMEDKPSDVECGRSGCTCCSGKWITGNSGPTLKPEEVCKEFELTPSKPCPPVGCAKDMQQCKDGSAVARDPLNNCEFFPCP